MVMKLPSGHVARFSGFSIDGVLDETLREGSERCMFSVSTEEKLPLIRSILKTGVKDIIFGSGPDDPADMAHVMQQLEAEQALDGHKFSFILLLNCFKPLMPQFAAIPASLRKHVTISFGMITHDSDEKLFEKTVDEFRALGFDSFRVSLLNNFSSEIDEKTYAGITAQIDRSRHVGIETIRINDSLGSIYPEAMAVLAANLRHDYPVTDFCLHAHNDLGFGLQNALVSLYNGFNMVEGGFAEFGNRSGLPAIELLNRIFAEKNITVRSGPLNTKAIMETTQLAERTFLALPDLFRPVSGLITDCENMGVTNIPDYLGASSASRYFLNRIGLHQPTLEKILKDLGVDGEKDIATHSVEFADYLAHRMHETTVRKTFEYRSLCRMVESFYQDDVLFSDRVYNLARDYLNAGLRRSRAA
jgi:2-isopropylmalate synthase